DPIIQGIRARQTTTPCGQLYSSDRTVFDHVLSHDCTDVVMVCDCPRSPIKAADACKNIDAESRRILHYVLLKPDVNHIIHTVTGRKGHRSLPASDQYPANLVPLHGVPLHSRTYVVVGTIIMSC